MNLISSLKLLLFTPTGEWQERAWIAALSTKLKNATKEIANRLKYNICMEVTQAQTLALPSLSVTARTGLNFELTVASWALLNGTQSKNKNINDFSVWFEVFLHLLSMFPREIFLRVEWTHLYFIFSTLTLVSQMWMNVKLAPTTVTCTPRVSMSLEALGAAAEKVGLEMESSVLVS